MQNKTNYNKYFGFNKNDETSMISENDGGIIIEFSSTDDSEARGKIHELSEIQWTVAKIPTPISSNQSTPKKKQAKKENPAIDSNWSKIRPDTPKSGASKLPTLVNKPPQLLAAPRPKARPQKKFVSKIPRPTKKLDKVDLTEKLNKIFAPFVADEPKTPRKMRRSNIGRMVQMHSTPEKATEEIRKMIQLHNSFF